MSMPLPPASGLEVARRLSADGRWQEASDAFARLDAGGGLDADGLAEFAVVSWMAGDFGACLELYGRSYRGHLDRGHHTAAAVVALSLAWEHEGRGEEAQSAGWAGRAMTLLEDEPQSVGHAWLTWWRARELIYAGDCVEAVELAEEAARLARRFGDADLEVLTRWYGGRALIGWGRVGGGFWGNDEGRGAAAGGEGAGVGSGAGFCPPGPRGP